MVATSIFHSGFLLRISSNTHTKCSNSIKFVNQFNSSMGQNQPNCVRASNYKNDFLDEKGNFFCCSAQILSLFFFRPVCLSFDVDTCLRVMRSVAVSFIHLTEYFDSLSSCDHCAMQWSVIKAQRNALVTQTISFH